MLPLAGGSVGGSGDVDPLGCFSVLMAGVGYPTSSRKLLSFRLAGIFFISWLVAYLPDIRCTSMYT